MRVSPSERISGDPWLAMNVLRIGIRPPSSRAAARISTAISSGRSAIGGIKITISASTSGSLATARIARA